MAFTGSEFLGGAVSAWLWFLLLSAAAWTLTLGPYVVVAVIHIVPWSLAALAAFATPAYVLGRALRARTRVRTHLAAFGALGLLVGGSVTGVFFAVAGGFRGLDGMIEWLIVAVNVFGSAGAVMLGWWRAARRALRPNAAPARIDPDALAEDAAADRR